MQMNRYVMVGAVEQGPVSLTSPSLFFYVLLLFVHHFSVFKTGTSNVSGRFNGHGSPLC